jgi:hypothetical protein
MTGGILQLVSYGIEDIFLIGNPQITYFKTIYRRHTNFSRGEHDLLFRNRIDFGRQSTVIIKKLGDLVHRLFLMIKLPRIDIRFRTITVREVKSYLLTFDITWNTDRPDDELFDEVAFNEVIILIENKKVELAETKQNIDTILSLLDEGGELHPETFFLNNPNLDETSEPEYYDFVIDRLIELDPLVLQYKYVNAEDKDSQTNDLNLINAIALQNLLFEAFTDFATGKTTFDPDSFNDENLFFIFNTDTANYSISGASNQVTASAVFRQGIRNAYDDNVNFFIFDAYKIFDKTLIDQNTIINSNFDIQVLKQILLDNERFGLIKNPRLLLNVYKSLDKGFKFIFYKQQRRVGNTILGNDEFINVSQIVTTAPELNDNWTTDFILLPEPNEPSSIKHLYSSVVTDKITSYHTNNRNLFRTNRFTDYFNNSQLWSRIDVGNPGDLQLDTFNDLCKSEIQALFNGIIPQSLKRMYFLGYIPLLTSNDIPIAIDRHLNNRIAQGDDNADNITAFKSDLISQLQNLGNDIIDILKPLICNDDTILTINRLSDVRGNRIGDTGNIVINAVIKYDVFLEFNNVKYSYPAYVIERFKDLVNNYSATGYIQGMKPYH